MKLWRMAKRITELQRKAAEQGPANVDWDMLEEMWFDWLDDNVALVKKDKPNSEALP
jgi:hypothetical protein